MLDVALKFLAEELQAHLRSSLGNAEFKATLTQVVDENGKYAFAKEGLGLSVVQIEEERTVKEHLPEYVYVNGQHLVTEPELRLNVQVLCAANFTHHDEALKCLAQVLLWFHTHRVFTPDAFPSLDARIQKLLVELLAPNYEQMNQLWAYLGAKYLPSVVYRVRLVVLKPELPMAVLPPLTKLGLELHSR